MGHSNSLHQNTKVVPSIAPNLYTTNNTTVQGSAVDRKGFDNVMFEFGIGTYGDTAADGFFVAIQDTNDTTGTWTDVADTLVSGSIDVSPTVSAAPASGYFAACGDTDNDNRVSTATYLGDKRYVRALLVSQENASNGSDLYCNAVLYNPATAPDTFNAGSA